MPGVAGTHMALNGTPGIEVGGTRRIQARVEPRDPEGFPAWAGRVSDGLGYQPRNWPWMVQKAASAAMPARPVPVARRRRTGRPADRRRPRVVTCRASLA